MAKKKVAKKAAANAGGVKRTQLYLVLLFLILLSAVFFATALIFYLGMIPAFVAFFVDSTKGKTKSVTVASFNLIGCMPFALQLWGSDHSVDTALDIIVNPLALVVIYFAAGVGYFLYWGVASVVSGMLYQQAKSRLKQIEKRKKELVERWGREVTRSGDAGL